MPRTYPPLRSLTPEEQALVLSCEKMAHKEANRIAHAIATKYYRRPDRCICTMLASELIGHAYLGLCIAAQRFDPARGVKFSTLAHHTIRGQVGKGSEIAILRLGPPCKVGKQVRIGNLSEIAVQRNSDNDNFDILDGRSPGDEQALLRDRLETFLGEHLDPLKARIVSRHALDGETFAAIGSEVGKSVSRVQQIYHAALARLRKIPVFLNQLSDFVEARHAGSYHDLGDNIFIQIA